MEMINVESTNLEAIGYDEGQNILHVQFKHGGTYQYFSVDKSIYDGFFNAESQGKYFDLNVKKAGYEFSKV